MGVGGKVPAIEQQTWLAGRFGIVPIIDRNEHEIRGCADPYSTESHLQSAHQVQVLEKYRFLVEFVVAVRVLENKDSVRAPKYVLELRCIRFRWVRAGHSLHFGRRSMATGIGESLRHPDTT